MAWSLPYGIADGFCSGCGKCSCEICCGCEGCTCTSCLPGKVQAAKGGWGVPHVCGCKCCYIPYATCCTGCDCGYVALVPAKAKASAVLAALFLMAARNVEEVGSYQILLALSLFLMMMTAFLFAVGSRRSAPAGSKAGSLKEPLVHEGTDDIP